MTNQNPGKKSPSHDPEWAEAAKKCRLNAETIRMAKELGLKPRTLLKNIPSPSQQWKAPVHVWIRELYAKKFGEKGAAKHVRGERPGGSQASRHQPPREPGPELAPSPFEWEGLETMEPPADWV